MNDNGVKPSLICIVDDDPDIRDSLETLLKSVGHHVLSFAAPEQFLACEETDAAACLLLDVRLSDANGLDFQEALLDSDTLVPVILMSGHGDVPMTVRAMRAGAVTFLTKPFDAEALFTAIDEAIERDRARRHAQLAQQSIQTRYDGLTPRERDVFGLVTAGLMNKQVAGQLALSEVTVKIHRGNMMRKMKADSLADLVRMAQALGIREDVTRYRQRQGLNSTDGL